MATKKIKVFEPEVQEQNNSPIVITGGQIKGDNCTFFYKENIGSGIINEIKVVSKLEMHEDLKNAFAGLSSHLAVVCEEVLPAKIRSIEEHIGTNDLTTSMLDKFYVNSFSVVDGGIILSGEKILEGGGNVSLKTPEIESDRDYAFRSELFNQVELLKSEIEMYMQGKSAPKSQMDMFEGVPDATIEEA